MPKVSATRQLLKNLGVETELRNFLGKLEQMPLKIVNSGRSELRSNWGQKGKIGTLKVQ
jgi:hypothetical protein